MWKKIYGNLYNKFFELTKKRRIRKLNELVSKNEVTQSVTNIIYKKKWVINISSRQLNHIETDLPNLTYLFMTCKLMLLFT